MRISTITRRESPFMGTHAIRDFVTTDKRRIARDYGVGWVMA